MNLQDDPLYEELRDGYLTESADGASALLEIFVLVFIAIPVAIISGIVRLIHGR